MNIEFEKRERFYIDLICQMFEDNPERKNHIFGVVAKMKQICGDLDIKLGSDVYEDCVTLAYLHDIGYAKPLNIFNFHAVDGFMYVLENLEGIVTNKFVAFAILNHTHSKLLFEMLLADDSLENIEYSKDIEELYELASNKLNGVYVQELVYLITLADMQVNSKGDFVSISERVDDVVCRYGNESVISKHIIEVKNIIKI